MGKCSGFWCSPCKCCLSRNCQSISLGLRPTSNKVIYLRIGWGDTRSTPTKLALWCGSRHQFEPRHIGLGFTVKLQLISWVPNTLPFPCSSPPLHQHLLLELSWIVHLDAIGGQESSRDESQWSSSTARSLPLHETAMATWMLCLILHKFVVSFLFTNLANGYPWACSMGTQFYTMSA